MANLIIQHQLKNSVEIGVYKGSSFLPQAIAQRHIGGIAVGIDPYSAQKSEQEDNRERLDPLQPIIETIPWDEIYQSVLNRIREHGLEDNCRLLRMPSDEASTKVGVTLDMVHIDGNHDYDQVRRDLANYLPKLRVGGFLIMDDTDWLTITPQYEQLKETMEVVCEDVYRTGQAPFWAVLRKR